MSLKSISKNTLIYSIGTLALRFTTFLLIPLYTHYLTKSEFGLLQTLLLTIQIIITINDVGTRSALMRFFHEFDAINKLDDLLGSSLSLNFLTGLLLISISFFIPDSFLSEIFNIKEIPNLLLYTIIVGVLQTLSLNILSYFRALDQGFIYMLVSLLTSFFLIITTYVFLVIFNLGIVGVLWAQSFTFALMWIMVLIWVVKEQGIKISFKTVSQLFKFGFPLIFAMSGDLIINTSGNYLLGYFNNLEEVAIFSLAYKIAAISIMLLIGPFQMAYEPFIFRNKNNSDIKKLISKISTYVLIAYTILSIGILLIFKDLISLIGNNNYNDSYYLLFLLLPGIGFTLFNYIGQSLLHFNNKTKLTGTIVLFSTVLSLFVSYFLIKYLGTIGLVISLNFYLLLSSLLLLYYGIKEVKIELEIKRIFIISIFGVGSFITIYLLSFAASSTFYIISCLLLVGSSSILYFTNFFDLKEKETLRRLLNNFFTRIF